MYILNKNFQFPVKFCIRNFYDCYKKLTVTEFYQNHKPSSSTTFLRSIGRQLNTGMVVDDHQAFQITKTVKM